jgi:hypothetical protein
MIIKDNLYMTWYRILLDNKNYNKNPADIIYELNWKLLKNIII